MTLTDREIAHRAQFKMLGIIAICFGALAMLVPGLAGYSVAILVGVLVAAAGAVRLYWAFHANTLGRGLVVFGIGGLTFIAGVAIAIHPIYASGVLTLILTLYFFADGAAEIAAGYFFRPLQGWHWLVLGGVISLLLSLMIFSQFPFSGAWAVGILLGIKLLFIGLIMVNVPTHIADGS